MKKGIGLWIDHKKAVIIVPRKNSIETLYVESNIENHTHISSGKLSHKECGSQDYWVEDSYQRHIRERLAKYYDEIIHAIEDADSILIFGPGEAKVELKKHIAQKKPNWQIAAVEAADKMTDWEIADKVLNYFSQKTAALGY